MRTYPGDLIEMRTENVTTLGEADQVDIKFPDEEVHAASRQEFSARCAVLDVASGLPASAEHAGEARYVRLAISDKPICVDLDGTLVLSDTLIENVLTIASVRRGLLTLPILFLSSRAAFKQKVSQIAPLNPALLPYNWPLIEYLTEEKRRGRRLVLATAADERTARLVADHLDIFDEIVASDGKNNLKGEQKAHALSRRYGFKGFDYAGNDRADLPVWQEADGIIIVNVSNAVAKAARNAGNVISEFHNRPQKLAATLRAMRPHQWVKNLLVFVPLLTAHAFTDWSGMLGALVLAAGFCATASGIYLVNDLLDLTADRNHPRKCKRPFASGALSLTFGMGLALTLLTIGFGLAAQTGALHLLLLYAAMSLSYSLMLKQFPLLDVFMLAALYTLQIVAGGVASTHPVSVWLLGFSGLTFLSLALVKRCAELPREVATFDIASRRGYSYKDRPMLANFGVTSAFASSIVLALYVSSAAVANQYHSPEILCGLVPLFLFWQCRLWLSTDRGNMHDDPIVFTFRDWVSWIVGAAIITDIILASDFFAAII